MELHHFYDITREITVENPTVSKDKRNNIYKWGDDNLFPQYLASLRYNCSIHGGIINSKVHYTVSGGLKYDGVSQEIFKKFISNGKSDYNLNEVTQFLSADYETFNAYAFTVTFVGGKVYQINPVNFETLRLGLDDKWRGCDDWTDRKEKVIEYQTLDLNNRVGTHLVVYQEPTSQIKLEKKLIKSLYPVPTYFGGILAIETDIEINSYRRNEIANNFSLGTILNFNSGQPADKDDKRRISSEIRNTGQGSSNAGGVMVVFNNGKDNATTVTNLTGNDLHLRYMALSKDNKENILQAHSVTSPMLFGIKTEGQLGGATELETSYNLMKEGYFKYRQKAIACTLTYLFNKVEGGIGELEFNDVTIGIAKEEQTPTNQFNFNSLPEQQQKDKVIDLFKMVGKPKEKSKIIFSRPLDVNDLDEQKFISSYKSFAEVTNKQLDVLALINKGIPFEEIATTLKISNSELSKAWSNLEAEGLISDNKVTEAGQKTLVANDKVEVSVVYSYEVRPELGQPEIIPTTRDFCRDLIEMNKVYTRFEIDQISSIVGRDVWAYRGGWYHDPKRDITTKSCRHYWQQNLVIG